MPIDIPMMSDLPYRSPISISHGIPRLGVAAVDTSYAIVRASFSPNHHSKSAFSRKLATEVVGAERAECQ